MIEPRNTNRWRRLREELRAGVTNCAECDRLLDHSTPKATGYPTLDHIVPLAHGGAPFALSNLRIICTGCNSRKAARIRNGTADLHPSPQPRRWVL